MHVRSRHLCVLYFVVYLECDRQPLAVTEDICMRCMYVFVDAFVVDVITLSTAGLRSPADSMLTATALALRPVPVWLVLLRGPPVPCLVIRLR